MLRFRWAVLLPVVLTSLLSFPTPVSARSVKAESVHVTFGLKRQYASLTRGFKTIGGLHFESPQSDATWMNGVVFNIAFRKFFIGGGYSVATFEDWDFPTIPLPLGPVIFAQGGRVDVSEIDLVFGYHLARWISPYVRYLHHRQENDSTCLRCIATVDLADVGSGLMVNLPLPNSRWGVSLKVGYIRGFAIQGNSDHGFSLEAALSYTGIRMPVVGVLGYSLHRFDYPDDEVSCGPNCYRNRDVLEGPTAMVHYILQ